MTDDLIAFVRARLDEKAARATAVRSDGWYRADDLIRQGFEPEDAALIATDADPAHVLRGVAAKRAAVNEAAYWHDKMLADDPHPMPGLADRVVVARSMLCALAAEWSGHPAYDPGWVGSA